MWNRFAIFCMPKAWRCISHIRNGMEAVLGRFANTVVVSDDERSFACERLKIPEARLHFIANGVDTDKFCPASPEEKRRRREALGLPIDQPILGFIGRSSEQKDP